MIGVPAVEATELRKSYGTAEVVAGVTFRVGPGECLGVLGPNGAGKTTTVRMITCFTPITAGTARVFGRDVAAEPRQVKALLGLCPQEDNLDPDFTVRRNLLVYARYFDIPRREAERRADELLDMVQLREKAHAGVAELSGGMKRRLILARTLLHRPRLLVLDEPTTGLDPQARHLMWGRIRQLRAEGVSVLLTTHYMEEASQLCDRVLLFHEGRILLEGAPAELVAREVGREVVEMWDVEPGVKDLVTSRGFHVEESEGRLYVHDPAGGEVARAVAEAFPRQERSVRHATLEDVFLRRAGRTLRD